LRRALRSGRLRLFLLVVARGLGTRGRLVVAILVVGSQGALCSRGLRLVVSVGVLHARSARRVGVLLVVVLRVVRHREILGSFGALRAGRHGLYSPVRGEARDERIVGGYLIGKPARDRLGADEDAGLVRLRIDTAPPLHKRIERGRG